VRFFVDCGAGDTLSLFRFGALVIVVIDRSGWGSSCMIELVEVAGK
jgi:hypothetical protein